MEIKSRIAVGILALAVSCSGAIAQSQAQGQQGQNPPPAQQGQMQGPSNGSGGRNFMRQGGGPMGPAGQIGPRGFGGGLMGRQRFNRGGQMGRGFGQRDRMGMRGRGMGDRGFPHGGFLNSPAMRQRLGITPDQTTRIHQQDLDFQKSQIRNRADLDVKRIELNELLAADNPDRNAINAKLQEVSTAQMASEKAGIDNRLALRDILTPAQRTQLQQLRTNGYPQNGTAQAPPRAGGRGGAGRGQRGTLPPPPNQPAQPPANQ